MQKIKLTNEKDKYLKLELSHYEFQMLRDIINESQHEEKDWFSSQNLQDLKSLLNGVGVQ